MNFQIPNCAHAVLKAGTPVSKSQKLLAEDSSLLAPPAFAELFYSVRTLETPKAAAAYRGGDKMDDLSIKEDRGELGVLNPAAHKKQINQQSTETATSFKIPVLLTPANPSRVRASESGPSQPSVENIQIRASVHESVSSTRDRGRIPWAIQSLSQDAPTSGVTLRIPPVGTPAAPNEPIASDTGKAAEFSFMPQDVPKIQYGRAHGQAIGMAVKLFASAADPAGVDPDASAMSFFSHGHPMTHKGREAAGFKQIGTGRGFIGQATMRIVPGPLEPRTKAGKDAEAKIKSGAPAQASSLPSSRLSSKSSTTMAAAEEKLVPILSREAHILGEVAQRQAPPPLSKLEYIHNLSQLAEKIRACAQLRQGIEAVLEFQLTPPRLGSLMLRVQMEGQEMRLYFGAEQEGALQMLKEMRADLAQIAAEQGYDLERCEVEHQAMPDHRSPTEGAIWADHQRSSHPMGQASNAFAARPSEEVAEESPRGLDFGYNTFDLVA